MCLSRWARSAAPGESTGVEHSVVGGASGDTDVRSGIGRGSVKGDVDGVEEKTENFMLIDYGVGTAARCRRNTRDLMPCQYTESPLDMSGHRTATHQ